MIHLLEGDGTPFLAGRSRAVSAGACRRFFLCSTLLLFWNLILVKPGVLFKVWFFFFSAR